MIDVFLWIWSNLAFVSAIAGLVALWWVWPRLALVGAPVALLIVVSALLGGFGWGEKRYIDGREAGASVERIKWEKSYELLKRDLENEKNMAADEIEQIRSQFVELQKEKEAIKQDAAVSNARIIQSIISSNPKDRVVICEKANEKIIIEACPNPYAVTVDPRNVRNLQRSRNQNGTGKGSN
ncbi:MAG: hypothetical protein WBD01_07915 [Salaquimonas sp.]